MLLFLEEHKCYCKEWTLIQNTFKCILKISVANVYENDYSYGLIDLWLCNACMCFKLVHLSDEQSNISWNLWRLFLNISCYKFLGYALQVIASLFSTGCVIVNLDMVAFCCEDMAATLQMAWFPTTVVDCGFHRKTNQQDYTWFDTWQEVDSGKWQ